MPSSPTYRPIRLVISGGGTGGHLFPAIAIAQQVQALQPASKVLFVGAQGKMEMEKVPKYGYEIKGLPIAGFNRQNKLKNLGLPFKILKSLWLSRRIVKQFAPQVAVGVGGYASGPLLWAAEKAGIPALLQEQNSYAGVTNKLLAAKAQKICVAFPDMERFFPAEKLEYTGNPIRESLTARGKKESLHQWKLPANKPTLLIIGGSLGARTINEAIEHDLSAFTQANINVIWQTGKFYYDGISSRNPELPENIKVQAFIDDMSSAYGAADVVISRAGALSIAEILALGKASILVPSPNVAEDHQTRNAESLIAQNAAVMVTDQDAPNSLVAQALALLQNPEQRDKMAQNALKMAKPDAALHIAQLVYAIAK